MAIETVNLDSLEPSLKDALCGVKVLKWDKCLILYFMAMGLVDSCEERILDVIDLAISLDCQTISFSLDGYSFEQTIENLLVIYQNSDSSKMLYIRDHLLELSGEYEIVFDRY